MTFFHADWWLDHERRPRSNYWLYHHFFTDRHGGTGMNKSESIANLATALAMAQMNIKGAIKDSNNPFFKSKYADLSSVVEAIRPAFGQCGLSYIQRVEPSDKDEVRVETILLHASGEWLSCGVLNLPVSKADAQGYGSALTYARRYSLAAACGVAPEDDDGNAATKASPKSIAVSVWDTMPADEQKFLSDIAEEVIAQINLNNIEGEKKYIEDQNLDADEKTALWSRFDSKQRAALKKG
jgi:hypothetical protein